MLKNVRVLIIEDDIYAQNMMAMLLARDWRTRVVGEISSHTSMRELTAFSDQRIDVAVIDSEVPGDPQRPFALAKEMLQWSKPPRLLFTATHVHEEFLTHAARLPGFAGLLLKEEVLFALASAVVQAAAGEVVLTPGVEPVARRVHFTGEPWIVSGANPTEGFTRREREIALLGILFNLNQRDVSDELSVSQYWVSEAISKAYEKLGLHEILSGEQQVDDYFDDEIVRDHCRDVLDRPANANGAARKAPWMATLAFHLLTRPQIKRQIDEE